MVEHHLELVEVVPLCGLAGAQVVVVVPGSESEGVELSVGIEQEDRRRLLVAHPGVIALPLAHDVHVVWVARETGNRAEAYSPVLPIEWNELCDRDIRSHLGHTQVTPKLKLELA